MNIKEVKTREEKQHALNVRTDVFIHEQGVSPEIEYDEFDEIAAHIIAYIDDKPVAAGRIRYVDGYGKIERVCVLKEYRKHHYGHKIMLFMEDVIKKNGYNHTKLHGQTRAEGFYKRLGYETISGEFLDANIPHVTMVKTL